VKIFQPILGQMAHNIIYIATQRVKTKVIPPWVGTGGFSSKPALALG
jgi:hypothetical protein